MFKRILVFAILLLMLVTISLFQIPVTRAAGRWVDGTANTASGSRAYRLWVPAGYTGETAVPLMMVLHGCTQNPNDIAAGTQFNTLADAQTFLVVYPEQPTSANFNRCWNWFETTSQARGAGEPAILAAIVDTIRSGYRVDTNRTYVAGISAGGAMAVIMGATYPDIFRGVGVVAGVEYKAGTDLVSGVLSLTQGGPDPNRQGVLAFQAMEDATRRMPLIVFHGTADTTVYPINGDQVVIQWAQTNDYVDDGNDNDSVDALADVTIDGQVTNGRTYTQIAYTDGAGSLLLEKWVINGMGHAWPGGSTDGSYTDPQGPNATGEMWRFFAASNGGNPSPTPEPPTTTATPDVAVTPTPTAPSTPVATATPTTPDNLVFTSLGSEDGYVAALTASGTTGAYAVGYTLAVGDSADAPMRGVLSFDTSSLPDNATIVAAELRLFYASAPIGTPWGAMGNLVGDIQAGCLGDSCALATEDFAAAVGLTEAVILRQPTASGAGTLISGEMIDPALAFIQTTGPTQIRLRFQQNSNNNRISDYLSLAGGEYFNQAYHPVLVVQYR